MELIGAAGLVLEFGVEHDLLQPRHLVRAEGQRPVGAHLDAGPAIVVVRGGDHGDAGHVEIELREIGHRRHREPDVVHLAARRHQAGDQRIFDRGRIAAEIMSGDDLLLDAELRDQRAEPHAQRLNAHQVDFLAEQPARVIFAKTGRLHHRLGFKGIGIRNQHGFRLRKHQRRPLGNAEGQRRRLSECPGAAEGGIGSFWRLFAAELAAEAPTAPAPSCRWRIRSA